MDLIVLDVESYYDSASGYTLKKQSTEDYVCDARAQDIGVAVARNDAPAAWFSGPREEIKRWLAQFELHKNAVVAHNMKFDGLWMARHWGVIPKLYIDTLSMARPVVGSHLKSLSLAKLVEYFGLGVKGDEVLRADGLRLEDFSPEQLRLYGEYCVNDVELTRKLYRRLRSHCRPRMPAAGVPFVRFPDDEMWSIDATMRMYIQPQLWLNVDTLEKNLVGIRERKQKVVADLEVQGVSAKTLRSNDKFAAFLESRGVDVPLKPSPASLKRGDDPVIMTYALGAKDEGFKAMREFYADDEFLSAVFAARVSEKSTAAERRHELYIHKAKTHGGIARVPLKYSGAHTTRDAGEDDENWQNPAKVSKDRLRYAIEAPPGYVIHDADQAQIEARITAKIAGQDDLVAQFARGEDIYSNHASDTFKRPVNRKMLLKREGGTILVSHNSGKVWQPADLSLLYNKPPKDWDGKSYAPDEKEGKVGKESILGLGFQMAAEKFRITLIGNANVNEPIEVVQGYVDAYREKYSRIVDLWAAAQAAMKNALLGRTTELDCLRFTPEGVEFPTGLMISYPNLGITGKGRLKYRRAKDKWDQNLFGGKITENFVQKIARDIVFWQANMITRETGYRHALRVHDSLIHVIPEDKVEAFSKAALEIMARRPPWMPNVPLLAEAKIGKTYGDT